jgi:rubrerythrin
MFSASEIFDLAIQIEENGERFYRQALAGLADQSLREMLFWLANEEAAHRDCFLKMKKSAPKSGSEDWAEQVSGAMLKSSMRDHLFSLDEVDLASSTDLNTLLATALELEQDSVMFYEIIASFVTKPHILTQLNAIIAEEQKHIETLRERREAFLEPAVPQ